jgi:hypothetical protein
MDLKIRRFSYFSFSIRPCHWRPGLAIKLASLVRRWQLSIYQRPPNYDELLGEGVSDVGRLWILTASIWQVRIGDDVTLIIPLGSRPREPIS